ncbi:hypothetical protein [Tepidibacillus marianensis]|uniref:hypothetical protein n=1 Tax=Tepidibacillus marianensis TaxID=3131995 RepID=UPI0030D42EE6
MPEGKYIQAKDILQDLSDQSGDKIENTKELQQDQIEYMQKRRRRVGTIEAYFYGPLLIVALYCLLKFIFSII